MIEKRTKEIEAANVSESVNHQSPELTEADFIKFSRLVYDQSGISLSESKKELVKARLGKRIRKGKFQSFGEYYNHVINDQSGEEMILLLDSISTNFTHFFRENHHFEYLKNQLVPQIKDRTGRNPKKNPNLERRLFFRGRTLFHRHYLAGVAGSRL